MAKNPIPEKITQLASAIIGLITKHENQTGSSLQKGHVQAGGAPQEIGQDLSAGTDNGYYARADHVHTVKFENIKNTPNALNVVDNLNTDDGSSPLSAKQGKWLNDNKASYQALNDKNVTVTKLATATTGYIATYEVKQGETSIGKIDIPKDYLVKSGTVKTVTIADDPVNGYEIGDKYIDFVINTKDSSGTDEHIYINVKDLIDTYTADNNTLQLSNNNQFSIKSGGVTSSHIANGTITGDNIASNAAIDFSKLNISKSNIVGLGIPAQDTIYTPASETPLTENYRGAVGTGTKYAREDHRHPTFDYLDSGTSGETGYVETIQIKVNGSYQDSPIKIEIFQRQSTQNSILFVRFENIGNTDPAIGSFYHSGSNNSGFWLYKKSAGTYSLIVKKAGVEAHDNIRLKVTNPNAAIAISNINSQLANLPSNTTTNPLLKSTDIGFTQDEKTKLAGIATEANKTTIANNLTTTTTGSALDATQGKELKTLVENIQVSGANLLTGTQLFNSPITATPGASRLNGTYYGCNVRYLKNTGSSYIDFAWSIPYEQLESNGYYVLSFWAKTTTAHDYVYTYFYSGNVNTKRIKSNTTVSGYSGNGSFGDGSTRFALSTEWKRYYVVYQLNNTAPGTANKNLTIRLSPNTSNPYDIYLAGVKFEKGTIPTEWSPHPNDWNEIPMAGSVTATDMATNQELNPNRLAYLPGNNITVEYSLNNGSTWTDYGASVDDKSRLVTSSYVFKAGKDETASASHQLRVTINAGGGNNTASNVYLVTRKLMIFFISGASAANTKVQVHTSTYGNPTTWNSVGTYRVAGNSGWNSIPLAIVFGGAASQTTGGNIQNIRLTFSTDMAYKFNVSKIRLYGENCWLNPSNLANNGHMYSYDINKNVTFPAKIIKSGGTSSQFLKADGSVDSNTYLTTTSASSTYQPKGNYLTSHNPIDTALSSTSTNAVQNKVINTALGNKVDKAQGSGNANKTLSTNASGNIVLEAKNNHTHNYLPTNANGTTTGTLTATKFINSSSNNTNILLGNGNTLAQSTFATSGHNHDGTYLKSYTPPTGSTSQAGIVKLNNNINSTSTTEAATANAVKTAYDKGNHSHPYAATSHTHTKSQITDFPTSMVPTFTLIDVYFAAQHDGLNSYVTGGFYYCNSNDSSYYIENQPLTSGRKAFFLLIETWGASSTNYVKQTLTYYHNNQTYTRTKADGTWGAWTEFATTNHNHSTWTEKQTYSNGNKKIHLYVNEQLRLCDLYWENVSAVTANTNLTIANDGWITSTYRPSHVAVGGGSYMGITSVGTGGGIVYRIPVTINSNTIRGQAMWHY